MSSFKICTLVPPPSQPARPISPPAEDWPEEILHLGVVKSKTWPVGHTLKIKLIGGSRRIREKVEFYAREWTRHANIKMSFVEDVTRAEVRVTFKRGGSWSVVGRDCLAIAAGGPTMNFGWFDDATPERELARTVYHEFGHALGCVHEHQNPIRGILWDERRVYDYYADEMGWDEGTVDRNILTQYSRDLTQFSRFDRDSIMLYHFPKELTRNGHYVRPNNVLSPADIDFIARIYPFHAPSTQPPAARRRREVAWPGTSPMQPRRSPRIARLLARQSGTMEGVKSKGATFIYSMPPQLSRHVHSLILCFPGRKPKPRRKRTTA
ncbi:hypothetical protein F5X97DRAFT_161942 [Nemania serpens]|nr:hypothetical protein F5X97DRAFT_161942 [Nemania serpens]